MIDKNIEDMSLVQLVDYITKTYHEPLRKNLKELDILVESLNNNHTKNYPELVHLKDLFWQFKTEILKHITKEDFVTFPSILRFEKIYTDKIIELSDDFELMDKLVNDVVMKNQHTEFNLYLSSIIDLLEWSDIKNKWVNEYETAKKIFLNIQEENITHSEIENTDLYFKWIELQNKLKNKLKNYLV